MSTLSIFIDESGSFKGFDPKAAYYGLTFVFHEQELPIDEYLAKLDSALAATVYQPGQALHAMPMIRREDEYTNQSIDERRQQFSRLFAFVRSCPITYKSFVFRKREVLENHSGEKTLRLLKRLSGAVAAFVRNNLDYFSSFDTVVAYYDNGQTEINQILVSVFTSLLFDVDFRPATPANYRLFQAADMICTLEILKAKQSDKALSKSESSFFYKPQELKKNYLKPLSKKAYH